MTMREQLKSQGFMFYCFTTRQARAEFVSRTPPEEFACVDVDETLAKRFEVFFLGVRKFHHVPVKYTPPLERL